MNTIRSAAGRALLLVWLGMASAAAQSGGPEQKAEAGQALPLRAVEFRLSASELELWNSPEFKRDFAQSYLAESDVEPPYSPEEREQMLKIQELMSANQPDKAIALLNKSRGPAASAVFDFTLGNIHFQRDELPAAESDYKLAVDKFPRFRRAWGNLALVYARQDKYAAAVRAFGKHLETGGHDARTYGLMGVAYSNLKDYVNAESAFRMAALLEPSSLEWKIGIAESLRYQDRVADAIAMTNVLIEAKPDNSQLWMMQANAYLRSEEPLKAAQNLELVDRMGKSTVESLVLLADIYANEGLVTEAAARYERALERDPRKAVSRALLGARSLARRRATEQARSVLEHIEKVRGDDLDEEERTGVLKLRRELAAAAGSSEEEAAVLRQLIELNPLDGESLVALGRYEANSGSAEQAVFLFERAAGIEGFEADACVGHAQLLVKQGQYPDAVRLLKRAQGIRPRSAVASYLEQIERIAVSR